MSSDIVTELQELTAAAKSYCLGFPGPYERHGRCITGSCPGLTTLQLPTSEVAEQVLTALMEAPKGLRARIDALKESLHEGMDPPVSLEAVRLCEVEIDRAAAFQLGEW